MAQIGVDLGSYAFDASAKTITFSGVSITSIEQIKPIINGKRGEVIFNPATNGAFGVLVGNVLTLAYDTTGQADADELYICVNIPSIPIWGARVQITVDDTGLIQIPANVNRKAVRFSNEDGQECYFSFGATVPVWKEDVNLKKKVSLIFKVDEVGTGVVRFVTNNNKETIITYQEAT